MVAVVLPPSVPVEQMLKVYWVLTLADPNAPKLTELSAISSLDITCYLTKDGSFKDGSDQAKFVDARACTADEWEILGATKRSLENLIYVYGPQAAALAATNAAYEKLIPGTPGFFVIRRGLDYSATVAVGQFVSVWGATLGSRHEVGDTTNSVFKMTQGVSPSFYAEKVALVA
jgi:hypothetical protein